MLNWALSAALGFEIVIRGAALGIQSEVGAPFENPDECNVAGEECVLSFDVSEYNGPFAQFVTRGYNGQFPGPTIRVSPGRPVGVTIVNALSDDDTELHPNMTNFHAHGLHVSPNGGILFWAHSE